MYAQIEMTRKEELHSIIWDLYKDMYNVRPRHINFEGSTEAQLEALYESLMAQAQGVFDEQEREEKARVVKFEARVTSTIAAGAGDRETAIRWIAQAEGVDIADTDYLCYTVGIPYGYFTKK